MIYSFHGKVPSSKIEKCKEMKVSSQIVNLRQWKMLLICTLQIATPFQIYPISRRSQSSNLRDQSFLGSSSSSLFWPSKVNEVIASGKEEQGTARHEEGEAEFYQQVFDSIIKIYATHSEPDHIMPWQRKHPTTSTSSGFVIEGNRIMTNAHSVEHATMIQLQRRGDPTKYQAQLETIANECDLAILKVLEDANDDDDNDKTPDFWDNLSASLEFGSLPALQDEVEVLGYPQGGTGMSVTSGVVSRIELQQYAQSGMHFLAIQIDAAINSGNSGGPVVDVNGKVIGVAFQSLEQAENIGYVVPVTIVQHVLEDIRRNRQYTGFVCLGARFVYLENPQARSFLKLEGHKGGIMVRDCYKTCQAKDHIKPNDVILSIDGIPIGQDGNVLFRPGERVSVLSYIHTKFLNDILKLEVWRDIGKENGLQSSPQMLTVDVAVSPLVKLVPNHWNNQSPPFLILAGFVFSALSVPYLEACNAWDEYVSDPISHLVIQTQNAQEEEGDQVVILIQVLAHPANLGYDHLCDLQLKDFNGVKVRSLKHLYQLVHACEEKYVQMEFDPTGSIVILRREVLFNVTQQICEVHSIDKSYHNFNDLQHG